MAGRASAREEGCPRCGGLVAADVDRYGPFLSCLGCGWLDDRGMPLGGDDLAALVPPEVWRRVMALLDGAPDGGGLPSRAPGGREESR